MGTSMSFLKSSDSEVSKVYNAILNSVELKKGEQVLIVADLDTPTEQINALINAINHFGGLWTVVINPNIGWRAGGWTKMLTEPCKKAYEGADVIITATQNNSASLYGAPGRGPAPKLRARVRLRLQGRGFEPSYKRYLDTKEFAEMKKNAYKVYDIVKNSKTVHITSKLGTDFTAELNPERRHKPDLGGFPAGELDGGLIIGSAEGIIVADGPIQMVSDNRPVSEPVKIFVEKGKVVKLEGGEEAEELRELIATFGPKSELLCEWGVGFNPKQRGIPAPLQTAKKALGHIHIAFAGHHHYVHPDEYVCLDTHIDCILYPPLNLEFDGVTVLKNGKFVI